MKKKIAALLAKKHAAFNICHAAYLRRFQGDVMGTHRDILALEFLPLGGSAQIHQRSVEIKSRDPEEIIRFCADMMEHHFAEVAQQIASNLLNGYNDASNADIRDI